MKRQIKKYFLAILLCLLPTLVFGQAKVYTKSAKLADFPSKVTKVVLTGIPLLDASIRQEIITLWQVSPYEFCTAEEYTELEFSPLYYFLHFDTDGEFTYMMLRKGGPANDSDPLKKAIDIIEIPIGPDGSDYSTTIEYMDVFVDLIQQYIVKAMNSDRAAYSGIKAIIKRPKVGAEYKDIEILPTAGGWGTVCYKIRFNPETHDLYSFRKKKIDR